MRCQGIVWRAFDVGLTSAEGWKLKGFEWKQIKFFEHNENLVNPLCSKVLPVFYLTQALYMCILCVYFDLYVYTMISMCILWSLWSCLKFFSCQVSSFRSRESFSASRVTPDKKLKTFPKKIFFKQKLNISLVRRFV